MIVEGSAIDYILHLMKESDRYPVFKIPGAAKVGGQFVRLHDTYTQLKIVPRDKYEKPITGTKPDEKDNVVIAPDDHELSLSDYCSGMTQVDELLRKLPAFSSDMEGNSSKMSQQYIGDQSSKRKGIIAKKDDELLRKLSAFSSDTEENSSKMSQQYVGDQSSERKEIIAKQDSYKGSANWVNSEEVVKDFDEGKAHLTHPEKWKIFLSAPGGGKSTLLKMYALAYGYQYLKSIGFDFLSDDVAQILMESYKEDDDCEDFLQQYMNKVESICTELSKLDVIDSCFPIFVEARDLSNYTDKKTDIEDIFKKSISNCIYGNGFENLQVYPEKINELFEGIDNIVLIVDSIEEFIKPGSKDDFIEKLNEYDKSGKKTVKTIILSSRYKEYQDFEHESGRYEKEYQQYVINELYRDFDLISEFSEKWFNSLAFLSNDDEIRIGFIESLRTNEQALNLITNPLELTSLLLVSVSDRFLPSDSAKLYARSTELWLTWANRKQYNLDDVMIQMAHFAYQMAESEKNRIEINRDDLHKIILESREDLERYFKQDWHDKDVEEFVEFLCESHLLLFSGGTYEFYHRMYQAYFVAYCIKNNLFKKEKRKTRGYDYLEKHVNERDDFWNSIIFLIAVMDYNLRDEIIDEFLKHAKNKSDDIWYCLSILMQLVVVPGINFSKDELKELYTIIARDTNKPKYVSKKRQDVFKVLITSNESENDIFINAILDEYDSRADDTEKGDFRDSYATCVFFCLWNCKISDQSILRALKAFFPNFINTDIVSEIYNSRKTGGFKSRRLYTLLNELGIDSLNSAESVSNYYMLIAVMFGYMSDPLTPYDKVIELIDTDDAEKQIIAANILVVSAWLIRTLDDEKYGYSHKFIEGKEEIIARFINEHIADKKNNFRRDYIVAYLDYYSSDKIPKLLELLINDDTFDSCAEIAVESWRSKKKEDTLKFDEFSYELEYIATYPWGLLRNFYNYLREDEIDGFTKYVEKVIENSGKTDFKTKLEGYKLLAVIDRKNESTYISNMRKLKKENSHILRKSYSSIFANKIIGDGKHELISHNVTVANEIIKTYLDYDYGELSNANKEDTTYVDYYSMGEYEKAKEQYLNTFFSLSSRNNLAYMLRRGEVNEVVNDGEKLDVPRLLEEGLQKFEPFSLMNYALFLSYREGIYIYRSGLEFLEEKKRKSNLLLAADWWMKLRKNNELEGYIVISWLCDLGLYDFDSSAVLKEIMINEFSDKVII